MSWTQLQLSTSPDRAEQLQSILEQSGAVSVTLLDDADQPLFEPGPGETPLWNNVLLTALFENEITLANLQDKLSDSLHRNELENLSVEIIADQEWERAWIKDFKPVRFGQRLWVCPSWDNIDDPDAVIMQLDPGLAFGTGTHPTTALCLEWLDKHSIDNKVFIDYGCGSGILGIAALLLGANIVYGVDNDPQALAATASNCKKNKLSENQFITHYPHEFAQLLTSGSIAQVDGMLANILAGPLIELSQYLSAMVKPGGTLLISGVLKQQAEEVMQAYTNEFLLEPACIKGDWCCISGVKKTRQ